MNNNLIDITIVRPVSSEKHIKVGRGNVVHVLARNGQRAACGAGDVGVGSRRRSEFRVVDNPVTCKKCLAKMTGNSASADVLYALHLRDFIGCDAFSLEQHLALTFEYMTSYDPVTGKKDTTLAEREVEYDCAMWKKGEEYFEQGYRLRKTTRQCRGLGFTIPESALAWCVVSAGHIGTGEAERLLWVEKKDEKMGV